MLQKCLIDNYKRQRVKFFTSKSSSRCNTSYLFIIQYCFADSKAGVSRVTPTSSKQNKLQDEEHQRKKERKVNDVK